MEQIEIISWKILDALKQSVTKIFKTIGNLDTNEQMAIFCNIEEDYLELCYSEVDSNYIRRFEDEEEFFKNIEIRKKEFGEEEYNSIEFFDDDDNSTDENSGEDLTGFNIKEEDEEDDF